MFSMQNKPIQKWVSDTLDSASEIRITFGSFQVACFWKEYPKFLCMLWYGNLMPSDSRYRTCVISCDPITIIDLLYRTNRLCGTKLPISVVTQQKRIHITPAVNHDWYPTYKCPSCKNEPHIFSPQPRVRHPHYPYLTSTMARNWSYQALIGLALYAAVLLAAPCNAQRVGLAGYFVLLTYAVPVMSVSVW